MRQFDTEPLNAVEQIWHCQEPWLQLKPPAGDAAGPRHLCWLSDPLPNGNLNAGYSVQSKQKSAAHCCAPQTDSHGNPPVKPWARNCSLQQTLPVVLTGKENCSGCPGSSSFLLDSAAPAALAEL